MKMKILLLVLFLGVTIIEDCSACCCTSGGVKTNVFGYLGVSYDVCGCNFFNCNCEPDRSGYCRYQVFSGGWGSEGYQYAAGCSSKPLKDLPGHFREHACSKRRRRDTEDEFMKHDLNGDGKIDYMEANSTTEINVTEEDFAGLDTDLDGFIGLSEFDSDLE